MRFRAQTFRFPTPNTSESSIFLALTVLDGKLSPESFARSWPTIESFETNTLTNHFSDEILNTIRGMLLQAAQTECKLFLEERIDLTAEQVDGLGFTGLAWLMKQADKKEH